MFGYLCECDTSSTQVRYIYEKGTMTHLQSSYVTLTGRMMFAGLDINTM